MKRRGVLYEKEYAHELMGIAEEDLKAAFILWKAGVKRKENVFLLAQQALKKALKAVLCFQGEPVPLLHEIGVLVDRLPESLSPPFSNEFNSLTEYATIRRYLEGREMRDDETVGAALESIQRALEWCQSTLGSGSTGLVDHVE